jgi:hypothetical protein
MHKVEANEQCIEFKGMGSDKPVYEIGRMGHLTFVDVYTGHIIIFGGQICADIYQTKNQRCLSNDILIFDHESNRVVEQIVFNQSVVASRCYQCGFKINESIFVFGGMNNNG